MTTHAIVDHLEIRPRKAHVGLAWHCALVTPLRQKSRSYRTLLIWLAVSVPAILCGAVLVAGAFAKAIRWATL